MIKRAASPVRVLILGICWLALTPAAGAQSRHMIKLPPPSIPLKDLLPQPPDASAAPLPWRVTDLTQVPEILFQKVRRLDSFPKDFDKLYASSQVDYLRNTQTKAEEELRGVIAKVRHLDGKERDHFLRMLLHTRTDLAGLPFLLGDDCRMSRERAQMFNTQVATVRSVRNRMPDRNKFWDNLVAPDPKREVPNHARAQMAALMQILAIDHKLLGVGLARRLDEFPFLDATRCLTRLALFSFDADVRYAAVTALRSRPFGDYREDLLAGFQYPWPEVANFAAEAVAELEHKELIPDLEKLLEAPDPRAPQTKVVFGREIGVAREVVRLNHHHNCLLCHAIAKGAEPTEVFPTGPIPSPSQPLPSSQVYYESRGDPDLRVRADITYLRQDFSLMQKVSDPGPWPTEQRFDFLVRTRWLSEAEIADYRAWRAEQGPDYVSPHHKAVQSALQALRAPQQDREDRIRRFLQGLQK